MHSKNFKKQILEFNKFLKSNKNNINLFKNLGNNNNGIIINKILN